MAENSCLETILDDIVEVRIYPVSQVTVAIPVTIPGIREVASGKVVVSGGALLTLALGVDADGNYDTVPTLKVTSSRGKQGITYSHELSVQVERQPDELSAVAQNANTECYMLVRRADNAWYLVYTLPNTFNMTTDQSVSTSHSITVKATATSMSPLIKTGLSL